MININNDEDDESKSRSDSLNPKLSIKNNYKENYCLTWDHPHITIAELKTLDINNEVLVNNWLRVDQEIQIEDFGSIVKSAKLIEVFELVDKFKARDIEDLILNSLPAILNRAEFRTIKTIAINTYDHQQLISSNRYQSLLIRLKHNLVQSGRKTRMILPKSSLTLSNPQIFHHNLIKNGLDLNLVISANRLYLLQTTQISDFSFFRRIDNERPNRNLKVGQLSPRLAMSLINLVNPSPQNIVYDPFCGSGTIIQMALLKKYQAAGSDIAEKMVQGSNLNLEWLRTNFQLPSWSVWQANALDINDWPDHYLLVTEGYLGFKQYNRDLAKKLNHLYRNFLSNLSSYYPQNNNMVICLPFWFINGKKYFLNIDADFLQSIGLKSLHNQPNDDSTVNLGLLYRRGGQYTGHQILVLSKI